MDKIIQVKRKIKYIFDKDGKSIEKVFDVPEGVTSYPEQMLKVSLNAYIMLEHKDSQSTPEIDRINVFNFEDITHVTCLYKSNKPPQLEIYALNYNFIRPGRYY